MIDLFCGAGGFSEGAREAECIIALAVDNWQDALDIHAINHPDSEHWNADLGGDASEFATRITDFILTRLPSGAHVHVHASPPCQDITTLNSRRNEQTGIDMIRWTCELIRAIAPRTWTLEQVATPSVINTIVHYSDYAVIQMQEYGLCQTRKRLFAGTIDFSALTALKCSPPTMQQLFKSIGYSPPYNHVKNCNRPTDESHPGGVYRFRDFTGLSYTVCQRSPEFYEPVLRKGKVIPIDVIKVIQGFPVQYKFGSNKNRKMVSNSVPPMIAHKIMQCMIL